MVYLLHISDLHLVDDPNWNNMKNAILSSAREKLRNVSIGQKLLVVTGDFHNITQKNYHQTEKFLRELFEVMGIEAGMDAFFIPGNHDISISDSQRTSREDLIDATKYRKKISSDAKDKFLSYYDDYKNFVQRLGVYPAGCGVDPASVHVRTWRNKLNLLHLNTTLIADGDRGFGQMVDTLTATSDDMKKKLSFGNLPCIAIAHNSFYDLLESHQIQLSAMFFRSGINAYLCGDRHKLNTEIEEGRIRLVDGLSPVFIPNIVAYKGSTDEGDTYSDFGIVWHIWDENTGRVELEFLKWNPKEQAELQPDGRDHYEFHRIRQEPLQSPAVNNEDGPWCLNSSILEKGRYHVKDTHIRNFLRGGRCGWNLAFSDRIVLRDIVGTLYGYAIDGGIYALVGPGGEGKSTILKQFCAKLIKNGIPVFYDSGRGKLRIPQNIPEQSVFVIDNPPRNRRFKRFLNDVMENGLTLFLGERQNEWNLLKASLNISDRDVVEIQLQNLSQKEALHFARCVKDHLDCAKSEREIKEVFQDNSYGFLYAAMLMVVNKKDSLEEIAKKIIGNLKVQSHKAMLVLAHIVLSEWHNARFIKAQFKIVCSKLGISPLDANRALSREISLNGEIYQTRHTVISRLFYKELFSDAGELLLDEIDEILNNLISFYLDRFQTTYGRIKNEAWNCILQLSGALPQAGLATQKYLIARILDEMKSERPRAFSQLPAYLKEEEVLLLFYQQCFERGYILCGFLVKWCKLLRKNGVSWMGDEPYAPALIFRKACMEYNADGKVWQAWGSMEAKERGAGEYGEENTARWIYREACVNRNADSAAWLAWGNMEAKERGAGEYGEENTARWIFREACLAHNADGNVWLAWGNMEAKERGAGEYGEENTARWIYREACVNRNAYGAVWKAWGNMEAKERGAGEYGEENAARWIFREACLNHNADSAAWQAWGSMEAKERGAGEYGEENTARWIYREACVNRNADGDVWQAWGSMEAKERGAGEYGEENTARWIFREACVNHNANSKVWQAWGNMEAKERGAGEYGEENTARWIYREACVNRNADSAAWLAWGNMEAKERGAGEYGEENTARWIFREACVNHNANSKVWLAWGNMEAKERGAGEYREENTARWIFREACVERNAEGDVWLAWGNLEAKENRIGECEIENTARWIFAEGIRKFSNYSPIYSAYTDMELSAHSAGQARNILRQALSHNEALIGKLAILELFCGNVNSDDVFCTEHLIMEMNKRRQNLFGTKLFLYHCYKLLGRMSEAEECYRQIVQKPEFDITNTYVEEFIQRCREALGRV